MQQKANIDFVESYPLSVKAAVYNFLILREGFEFLDSLPYPSLAGIREFAYYAGISDGAIRSVLSRSNADGYIRIQKDEAGITRYRLTDSKLVLDMVNSHAERRPEGFLVAVFSFKKGEDKERGIVRETLKNLGFRKIAQNTYINGRIDTEGLVVPLMNRLGIEKHLYLFDCPKIDNPELIAKILGLFDIPRRAAALRDFQSALVPFLSESGFDGDEKARRAIYAGLCLWERFRSTEPPLPDRHLPVAYCFQDVCRLVDAYIAENAANIARYYASVNE
jgi:DNA-binding transcriptional regulator PaaX